MTIKKIMKTILHPIERHNEKSKPSESFHDVEIIPMTLDTWTSNEVKKFKISKVNWWTTIKIVGFLVIIWFFFILPTYAQEATTTSSLAWVQKFLSDILSLCSRWWIILAVLAGKLMTNDRVYGSILHMDIYLWKIWNIMKNFANFTLVAIVIGSIISNLVGKKEMNIKDIIIKTLVAGILIQASRFLVWAVVDISTIAVSAVGAFPSSFLKSDIALQTNIKDSLKKTPTRYLIDINTGSIQPIDTTYVDRSDTWDEILPTYNSVSWPLIYLWMSVFKFQNYLDTQGSTSGESLTISFLLRFVLIFFYTLWLALLFIANIIRVVFLRIFIIGSPFIILFTLFKDKLWVKEGGKWMMGYLNFEVMLDMIFKPVIFVAGFSLILIFIVSIQSIMQGSIPKSFNGVGIAIESWASTLTVDGISSIEVKENGVFGKDPLSTDTIKDVSQTIFVNLIIFFLTIFLMRQFIKMSITSGKWPIKDIMTPMVDWLEKAAKTAPVIPFKWGMSISAMQKFSAGQKTKLAKWFHMNTQWKFTEAEGRFEDLISAKMNILPGWKDRDWDDLQAVINQGGDFIGASKSLAPKRQWWLTLDASSWRKTKLEAYLATSAGQKAFYALWGRRKTDFETTFNTGDPKQTQINRRILHTRLWGDDAVYPKRHTSSANPPSYTQLTSNAYYKTINEKTDKTAEEAPVTK